MPVLPDPRGLWLQAAMGPLFLRNSFYPYLIFVVIHYATVWMTGPFNQMPPVGMWNFIVMMSYYFVYGTIGGYALSWAIGTPALIPTHDFHKIKAHPAPLIFALALVFGLHFLMHATGLAFTHAAFPSLSVEVNWLLFSISALIVVTIPVMTWFETKTVFTFRYADIKDQSIITEFLIMFVLVLGPQAIWDFFVLAPPNGFDWPQWQAGALTIGVEAVVWVATYFWFDRVRHVNTTIFTKRRSLVSWLEYCLIVGGTQIAVGVAYVIAADLLVDLFALNCFLIITTAVVIVESVCIYRWVRSRSRAKGVHFNTPIQKVNPSGSDTSRHRRTPSTRLELHDYEQLSDQ